MILPRNLAAIEETEDDACTGMENVKVLLKDPTRKSIANPLQEEKKPAQEKPLFRVDYAPKSEDILAKKRNMLNRECNQVTKQVERLASLQRNYQNEAQKSTEVINLPMIKPRHLVHQSVDSLPQSRLLGRLQNEIINLQEQSRAEKESQKSKQLINLRYRNRVNNDDD